MNNSYRLFETLRDSGADPALASSALTTAKDIHEIKKEYLLIMRGISEALEQELENDGMYLEEVLSLLKSSITNLAESQGKTLNLTYEYQKNFYTSSHYALLSIFRNLFVNALEASKTDTVNLSVTEVIEDGQAIFTVTDDGPGIPAEYIGEVFKTGFSTKIKFPDRGSQPGTWTESGTRSCRRGITWNDWSDLYSGSDSFYHLHPFK